MWFDEAFLFGNLSLLNIIYEKLNEKLKRQHKVNLGKKWHSLLIFNVQFK